MKRLSRTEKNWLILFIVIVIGLMAGCMIETVVDSSPWNPRPTLKAK
ncbi:MAG: hypothetical protein ACHQDF_01440 [Chitinophagales bacterium]